MTSRVVPPSAVVLHELRGPLGLMVTAARIAAEECNDESPLRRRVQTIERTALRLLESAEEVLSIAIADGAGADEPFDPGHVLVEAIDDVAALGRPVRLTVEGSCGWRAATGNASQLVALVHSLLGNAADHGTPGDPAEVVVACSDTAVELVVANTIGSSRHRGLGIGTGVCEQLAARLGGLLTRHRAGHRYEVRFTLAAPGVDGVHRSGDRPPETPFELVGSEGR